MADSWKTRKRAADRYLRWLEPKAIDELRRAGKHAEAEALSYARGSLRMGHIYQVGIPERFWGRQPETIMREDSGHGAQRDAATAQCGSMK